MSKRPLAADRIRAVFPSWRERERERERGDRLGERETETEKWDKSIQGWQGERTMNLYSFLTMNVSTVHMDWAQLQARSSCLERWKDQSPHLISREDVGLPVEQQLHYLKETLLS